MIAVLGSNLVDINNLIQNLNQKNNICEIANDNAEGQVIISGKKIQLNLLKLILKEKN